MIAVATVCRSALFVGVALLLWGILPALVGFQTTVVMSGSMMPKLQVGDAVVVRKLDVAKLVPGLVLLFDDPDKVGQLRMHRLVSMDDKWLTTRGDANAAPDSSKVTTDAVHGAGFLRVPYAGMPEYWIRTGQPLPLVLTGAVGLVLFAGSRLCVLLEDPEPRQRRRHRAKKQRRLRIPHRAVGASLLVAVVAATALGAPPESAQARFSAQTTNPANRWTSGCADLVPTGLPASTRFYWGYGPATEPTVTDLSTKNVPGKLAGTATRSACADKTRPYVSVGTNGAGAVIENATTSPGFPGAVTVATWFRTTRPGGVLADFGASTTITGSSQLDKALYMQNDGNLAFGGTTIALVGGSLGKVICATNLSTTNGYADGVWHLAVATWSSASRCSLSVDNGTAVTKGPPLGLSLGVLSAFSGAWRFGYDELDASWTGRPDRMSFIGDLDETQVYSEQSTTLGKTIWCTRRSPTDPVPAGC